MRDKDLYGTILGVRSPWRVTEVDLREKDQTVEVLIEHDRSESLRCPTCQSEGRLHDHRRRSWRHLDTCQYKTILTADVPRVVCAEHGTLQIQVPWAEDRARFTALFEALVIDWLREASISAVAERLRLSWDEVDGVMARSVQRGLARRPTDELVPRIGVDETSYRRRHWYATVVSDFDKGRVLDIAEDRERSSLEAFWKSRTPRQLAAIEAVVMDLAAGYVNATKAYVPDPERKIAFDRFHVARMLNEAVNTVRKQEHRDLRADGDERLTRTKFLWLEDPATLKGDRREHFETLKKAGLKVGRAHAMKEAARLLWHYTTLGWARKAWKGWISWVRRSRLPPMKRVAGTIARHLEGILNAVVLKVSNGPAEALNGKIQWVRRLACGFRNFDRFRNAVLFHCGGLDLYPAKLGECHTKV